MQQLDIFADSRDRELVNTLAEALARAEIDASRAAAEALRSEFPADRHLAHAAVLITALEAQQRAADAPWADAAAAGAWMAQAGWHLNGPDSAWPLLAERAWTAPQRLPPLLALLPDRRLHKLARGFETAFDTEPDWAWWPAWLLVEQPLLAAVLEPAQTAAETAPERGFKLLLSLLRLERQGRHHDIVALRRPLQGLHAALFAAYMATR